MIKGAVQGVSYRAWTVQTANTLGLTGWVRNLSDGSVETVVQGDQEDIRSFITSCYDGPGFSRVDSIDITDIKNAEIFKDFEFRKTL